MAHLLPVTPLTASHSAPLSAETDGDVRAAFASTGLSAGGHRPRRARAETTETPLTPVENAATIDILIVDDAAEKLVALEAALGSLGQNIVLAHSGYEALRLLLQRDFAVILLDVNMPGMDGFETAALIRQRPANVHTPIIFVTAFNTGDGDIYRGYSLGAVDYLFTPVTPEVLRSKISVFIELARKTQQVQRQAEVLRQHALHLQTLNQELESFSYSLAHDLRTPLRSISTYTEMLLTDEAKHLRPEAADLLTNVHRNGSRMLQLMDDFLCFFRIARQEVRRDKINMRALAREAITITNAATRNRDVRFTVGNLPPARGDSGMVLQVLVNLVSNAIKFTSERDVAKIEIGWNALGTPPSYFVKDNGVGFNMKYAGKLFGVFERLHSRDRFDGTGVGLATVQKIVQRHGGTITAESEEGRGATFHFTLPSS